MRFSIIRTILLITSGLLIATLSNALRSATLFYREIRPDLLDYEYGETLIGLICFTFSSVAILLISWCFETKEQPEKSVKKTPKLRVNLKNKTVSYILTCLIIFSLSGAASQTWDTPSISSNQIPGKKIEWPNQWNIEYLIPVELSGDTKDYWGNFPGSIAEYKMIPTGRRILFRFAYYPTRRLHAAEDCFRGMGYKIKYQNMLQKNLDESTQEWSVFDATNKDGQKFRVMQCYFAVKPEDVPSVNGSGWKGASWPDVSSWYWNSSIIGTKIKSVLAVTIIDGFDKDDD